MTACYKSGKWGRLTVDGTVVGVTNWNLAITSELQDVTNSESDGYQELTDGIERGSGTVTAKYNFDDPPHGTSPRIDTGKKLNLKLFLDRRENSNQFYQFDVYVGELAVDVDTGGGGGAAVEYTFNYRTTGKIHRPADASSSSSC